MIIIRPCTYTCIHVHVYSPRGVHFIGDQSTNQLTEQPCVHIIGTKTFQLNVTKFQPIRLQNRYLLNTTQPGTL